MNDENRPFPIQHGYSRDASGAMVRHPESTIPWWLAEIAYAHYSKKFGKSQSLERLAERGGFGREELVLLIREFNF